MIEIKSLVGESPERIYGAFMESFADYSVPVTWSREEFEASNARRGVDLSISLGAYEGERIVGFVLNGRGLWRGAPAAYDAGTGVVPTARGAGLAARLAERLKEALPGAGIRRYLLEVIRGNAPAFKTYERAGFRITRSFECPGGSFAEPGKPAPEGFAVGELAAFPRAEASAMRDWDPSWQNSDDSIARNPGRLVLLGAREGGELVGYLVASPNGTIWQLAVAPRARRRGAGTSLVRGLAARSGGAIRYVNVQSDDAATLGLLARCGVAEGPGQYEMALEL